MKKPLNRSEIPGSGQGSPDLSGWFGPGQGRNERLYRAALHRDAPYRLVAGEGFRCCEYHLRLNVFTFGKADFRLPFTIIGPPASFDETGYQGSLDKLADHYAGKRGNHLVLNLPEPYAGKGVCARTLSTAVLQNRFTDFEAYLDALRSPYRRRIRLALEKLGALSWEALAPEDFSDAHYRLYLQVLGRSDFPLETLGRDFFRSCPGELFALGEGDDPLAFILLEHGENHTTFLLGGMDYARRDDRDLYMNMLVKVVQEGIRRGSGEIRLGQTAEDSKRRLGAVLVPRYLLFLSSSRLLTAVARLVLKHSAYRDKSQPCRAFRQRDVV
jgi:hypothetical protein